jgi:hypothetical protein
MNGAAICALPKKVPKYYKNKYPTSDRHFSLVKIRELL